MTQATSASIRMYRFQELGDCFLLTFRHGEATSRVLIDCGSFRNSGTSKTRIKQVVADIAAQAKGIGLDVVVGTHQHNDHVSAFVHCETEFMIGRLGQIAAARAGAPIVTSYHTDFGRYTHAYGVPWLHSTVTNYLARFHRRAQRTYTPSEPARQDLLNMGVADVEVWGRGVDVELFHPTKRSTPLRESLGLAEKFVFIHVGRLAAEKNVHVVLDAFRQARELLPRGSVHLLVAGNGPAELDLRRRAPESVTFLGNLDRQNRLPDTYASADAFVFASLTETLGLVVLEAMASGLPVVAVAAGGVVDHLRDEDNGLAVPPAGLTTMTNGLKERMVRLARDPALRRSLALAARRTAEGRSWQCELDRLEQSYREVHAAWLTRRGASAPLPSFSLAREPR